MDLNNNKKKEGVKEKAAEWSVEAHLEGKKKTCSYIF